MYFKRETRSIFFGIESFQQGKIVFILSNNKSKGSLTKDNINYALRIKIKGHLLFLCQNGRWKPEVKVWDPKTA